ncbi:hypothetical protein GN956_G4843 [Arapaima gigas]
MNRPSLPHILRPAVLPRAPSSNPASRRMRGSGGREAAPSDGGILGSFVQNMAARGVNPFHGSDSEDEDAPGRYNDPLSPPAPPCSAGTSPSPDAAPVSAAAAEARLSMDAIAAQLLRDQYILTALELHAELLESGRELPRLRDYFSNPGNFERQSGTPPAAKEQGGMEGQLTLFQSSYCSRRYCLQLLLKALRCCSQSDTCTLQAARSSASRRAVQKDFNPWTSAALAHMQCKPHR